MSKTELMNVVRNSNHVTPDSQKYYVDELAAKYGHEVIRLPPYHCQFNAIELVWGIAKNYYNKHIGEVKGVEEEVKKMWQQSLDRITPEIWKNCIRHTNELIQKTFEKERVIEEVRPLTFMVNTESDREDDDYVFEDEDDSNVDSDN